MTAKHHRRPLLFKELLRQHRLSAGLSQEALAGQATLSVRAISDLERGLRRAPQRQTVQLLAKALGLSPADEETLESSVTRRRRVGPRASDSDGDSAPGSEPAAAVHDGASSGEQAAPVGAPVGTILGTVPHNLPIQATSFIGREAELADVKHLLDAGHPAPRLLTLTGVGGAGKTRLALQAAADMLDRFPDGVWVAELASIADSSLLTQVIASALGLREGDRRSLLTTLSDFLRHKRALLVLDNCEHIAGPCAVVADSLLQSCPRLVILATSREVLDIAGESSWQVQPLDLPDPRRLPPLERLRQYAAVRLFVDRAGQALERFSLTPENAPAVALICAQLDGIPLAIELAAAWVRILSVEQIAERLRDRFRLLTRGSRTALPRQQTLRALVDWSFALLSGPERVVFCRLSVFLGGWTLEAAEEVCAGDGVSESEVLDVLAGLVNKSLVQAEPQEGGGMRYRLLETLRQYGLERLEETTEAALVRGRHRSWCVSLAERAEPELFGPDQAVWLSRLGAEHDNLRAALDWSRSEAGGRASAIGLRLATCLWWFWYVRGYWSEGEAWLAGAAAEDLELDESLRAAALSRAGHLACWRGDYRRALSLAEAALALSRRLGDKRAMVYSLVTLGFVFYFRGDHSEAATLYAEGHQLALAIGDRWGTAMSLTFLGLVTGNQGDRRAAIAHHQESLALFRSLEDRWGTGLALHNLAFALRHEGDFAQAHVLGTEALAIAQALGNTWGITYALALLGLVAHHQDDGERATELLEQSLGLAREAGDKRSITVPLRGSGFVALTRGDGTAAAAAYQEAIALCAEIGGRRGLTACLAGVAGVATLRGQPLRAARMLGAAESLRDAIDHHLPLAEREAYDRTVAATRSSLAAEVFAAAWEEGRAMSVERAVAYAMEPGDRSAAE